MKRLLLIIAAMSFCHLSVCQEKPSPKETTPKTNDSTKHKAAKSNISDKVEDFHLSIGYQFDFINKANTNSLYYDVSIFKPGKKKFGIDFGIYQTGTNKATPTSSDPIRFYNEPDFYKKLSNDTIQIVHRTYYRTFTTTSSFQSPAVYISLLHEITPDILYGLVHVEFSGSTSRMALKDSLYQSDTTKMNFTQYLSRFPSVPVFGTKEVRTSDYSTFIGAGVLFRQQLSDNFLLRIKPIIGCQLSQRYDFSSTSFSGSFTRAASFRIDIRLISSGKIPFKLGGQAVGDFTTGFYGATFYLSKIFSPKKFADFLSN